MAERERKVRPKKVWQVLSNEEVETWLEPVTDTALKEILDGEKVRKARYPLVGADAFTTAVGIMDSTFFTCNLLNSLVVRHRVLRPMQAVAVPGSRSTSAYMPDVFMAYLSLLQSLKIDGKANGSRFTIRDVEARIERVREWLGDSPVEAQVYDPETPLKNPKLSKVIRLYPDMEA